ncbi:MAG: GGDEF domain-containing protein [Polyangiales bacterium]
MSVVEERKTSPYRVVGPAPDARPRDAQEACLVVLYGESIGRRIPLGRNTLTIGRAPANEFLLEEESVSRRHCEVQPLTESPGAAPHAWRLVDLESTNGTLVNDLPVRAQTLQHGDQVQVGRTILKFLVSGHIESAYHEEIYRLVATDGLTGLSNRRAFEDALGREFSRSTRYGRAMSVLMIDVDHFKRVNDVHGHLAGDAALRQVGAALRGSIRRDDLAGRMGGEEFAVLLPEIDHADALRVAEKLRVCVRERRIAYEGASIPLTISVGVATRAERDKQPTDLLRRADEALYAAKRAGRDRVVGSRG